MDHAGIATQTKVEARLREQGQDRFELGREKFLEATWS
jgi:valyl-tRNA synthetase